MKLSEYARRESIGYRAAWIRFHQGKIPGASINDLGRIVVPEPQVAVIPMAAVYARVSTHGQKDDLQRQVDRLTVFANANGLSVTQSIAEVGSGVNDQRKKLLRLLTKDYDTWGTLVIDHRDRLTRVGFNLIEAQLNRDGKRILVANAAGEDQRDLMEDFLAIMYSFAARMYGLRRSKNITEKVKKVLSDEAGNSENQ